MSSARVVVRVRPFSDQELVKGDTTPVVSVDSKSRVLVLDPAKGYKMEKMYPFDGVLWSVADRPLEGVETADQEDTYRMLCEDLVGNTFKGYNNCLLAYGQTGTGKTYTMLGGAGAARGVIPRMCEDLISRAAAERKAKTVSITMTASYVEVYMEKVYDLLGDVTSLRVRQHPQDGVFVESLMQRPFEDLDTLLAILAEGSASRHTAETKLNTHSSRSHAIFTINFQFTEQLDEAEQALYGVARNTKTSKLHLVDLAGSEMVAKSGVEGVGFTEATHINKSLMTLGRVIDALSDIGKKVKGALAPPYRVSTLTFLLSDSVGGNSKTTMVATISPHITNVDETMNTLRYASRARDIVNCAVTNEDPVIRKMRALLEDNEKLKRQMNSLRDKTALAAEDMQSEIINLKSENELLKAQTDRQNSGTFRAPAKKLKAPPKPEPPKPQLVSCLKPQSRVGFVDTKEKAPRDKELAKLKDDLKNSEKERKKLAMKHEKMTAKTEKAKEAMALKKDELSKRVSETDVCNAQLADENDTLQEELQEVTYNYQTTLNALEKLKAEHSSLKESSQQEIADLNDKMGALEAAKEASEKVVQDMKEQQAKELEALQSSLKEVSTNSKVGAARHIKALKHETTKASNMQSRVEELEAENGRLRAQLTPLEAKVRDMESCVATLHVQRRELISEEMNEAKIAQLENEVRCLEERLTSNLEDHLQESGELRDMLAEAQSNNATLAARTDTLKADLKVAYDTLAKANVAKEELNRKLLRVQGDCDILTVSKEANEMEIQSLKAAAAGADKLKQELLEQVMNRDSQETVEALQSANEELRKQVQSHKDEIKAINELQVKVNELHKHELASMQREMQREYTAAAKRTSLELETTLVRENIDLKESVASLTSAQEQLQQENGILRNKLKSQTAVDTTKQDIGQPIGKLNLESTEIKELLESKVAARKKQVLTTVAHVLHRKALIRCNTFWKWVLWSKEQQYARAEEALSSNLATQQERHLLDLQKARADAEQHAAALEARLSNAKAKKAGVMKHLASVKREAERQKKANASLKRGKGMLLEYTSGQADVHLRLANENAALRKENKRLDSRLAESSEVAEDLEARLQAKVLLLQQMENERVDPSKSVQLELRYLQLKEYCLAEMLNTKQAHNCLYLQFEQREYDSMLTHFESHVRGAKKREASIAKKLDTVMEHKDSLYEVYMCADNDQAVDSAVEALVDLFSEIRMCYPEGESAKTEKHLSAGKCAGRSKSPGRNMKRLSMSVSALQASQSTVPMLEKEILPLGNARALAQNIVKMQTPFVEDFFSPEQPKPRAVNADPLPPPPVAKRAPFQDLPTNAGTPSKGKAKRTRVKKDKCTLM
eukprot:TRINITY_DN2658_c0_g1_i1.p1 TRINITY_DN2658_c0_g1~~TRINITY_DN2658_c0_g1_i1.p1  ORF type:complete len:1360 (+),score=638.22 TRINITY_DN2658_c0_g1_i1:40-4119(+)